VVPDLGIRLFATDPAVEVTKRAYHGVTDSSSPAAIVATGTEAPLGSRLLDGQPVCWVYTVTNVSDDDWATALTDVEVVDTDTRLGQGGLVGVIPTLGMGETQQVAACAVMTPGDTRVAP
jgi:adhesin/invasin